MYHLSLDVGFLNVHLQLCFGLRRMVEGVVEFLFPVILWCMFWGSPGVGDYLPNFSRTGMRSLAIG